IGGPVGTAVLEEVDVEAAVVVEVEQGRARTHELREEVVADRAGVVEEVEAYFRCDITEPRRLLRRLGYGSRRTTPGAQAGEKTPKDGTNKHHSHWHFNLEFSATAGRTSGGAGPAPAG